MPAINPPNTSGFGYLSITPSMGYTVVQGTYTPANGNIICGSHNINDEIDFPIWLPQGTYSLNMRASKDTNYGILTVYFDSTSLGTFDCYNAGSSTDAILTPITGISVSNGYHLLKVICASKNASSSDYVFRIYEILIWRTA